MKARKVWTALLGTVALLSFTGLAFAAGVTPSSAPANDGGSRQEDSGAEAPHIVENLLPGETVTLPDGTVITWDRKDITQLDGTVVNCATKTTRYPDGRKEVEEVAQIVYADGTVARRTVHADGTMTESQSRRGSDGIVRTVETTKSAAGSVLVRKSVEVQKDGTVILTWDDGKAAVTFKGTEKGVLQPLSAPGAGVPSVIVVGGVSYNVNNAAGEGK